MNIRQRSLLLIFVMSITSSYGAEITENSLLKLAKKSNPTLAEIEASFLDSSVRADELSDKFGYEAYAGYNNEQTKEKSTISFQPIFRSVNQYKLGVRKSTKYGVLIDLNTSIDARSGDSESGSDYKDLHTTVYELGFQFDLWKDFMGRISKNQFDNLYDLKAKDELQKEISAYAFESNVRKLYWTIVANNEKLEIMKRLNKTAKNQAADAVKRKRSSVADKAEVARFKSLVHQRKGQLLSLEYEREMLFKNLRELFPNLNGQELKLGKYNLNKAFFEVLSCSAKIESTKEVPFESTKYDDITKILNRVKNRQGKIDSTYDDVDLKFALTLKKVGVSSDAKSTSYTEGSYQGSLDDIDENDRSAMSAGIMLTVPFGESKGSTATIKEKLTEKRFEASIDSMDAKVSSSHTQVQKSVKLLSQVIKEQKSNSTQFDIRLKEMNKQYRQARIPEYVLIQDQDALLQSDLNVIDTQLMIVNTILDYLAVFNEYDCAFNRKSL